MAVSGMTWKRLSPPWRLAGNRFARRHGMNTTGHCIVVGCLVFEPAGERFVLLPRRGVEVDRFEVSHLRKSLYREGADQHR